jgi:ABC-type branched-subunit amino acid transport system ATPase component/ABC-type branched-subunit amino acid transport system permease subunit
MIHLQLGLFSALLGAALVGGFLAFLVGALAIRRTGIYFVMLTLAFSQMAYFLAYTLSDWTGGDNGLLSVPRPEIRIGDTVLLSLADARVFYGFVAVLFLLIFIGARRVIASPFGSTLMAIRENETRASAIGYDTRHFKILVFVLSGAVTGIAGALYAMLLHFVPLSNIDLVMSENILIMTIVGGTGSLFGSLLGPVPSCCWGLSLRPVAALADAAGGDPDPGGDLYAWRLVGRPVGAVRTCAWQPQGPRRDQGGAAMSILLETKDLELAYGAFHAVNGVNLKVEAGTIHTIIGPNGAGKTSLFHCLTGERQATAGAIHFDGQNLMRKPAHSRVGLGMARSFQLTSLFQNLSVRENLRLGRPGRDGARALNFWRRVDSKREHLEMADQVLERLQLTARAETLAGELSHGQQRVLEVGMSICSKPKLLMLDEPTSGMGIDDIPNHDPTDQRPGPRPYGAADRAQHEHRHVHQPTHHCDEPRADPGRGHTGIRARRRARAQCLPGEAA